jgi:hypothetical protein
MNTLAKALGIAALTASILAAGSPAFALDGCGFNGHRNHWGRCVWGGQNQSYCLRKTGHPAVMSTNGAWVCVW